jgi:hypothetical protein
MPQFTVIIATYHWSSALNLSIRSVLAQTFRDFELLVVGDHCTDDSAELVAGFKDPRVRWINLPENTGSQWGPNNRGLESATGTYIAYLGQDDLWHPDHLKIAADLIERESPGAIAAGAVLYGQAGSKIRSVSGFLIGEAFTKDQTVVPSGFLHRRDLVTASGPWRDHRSLPEPVDVDFILRISKAAGKVVPTGKLTVFKWPAAWRRDSYRKRDVTEQTDALRALTGSASTRSAFTEEQMLSIVQAAVDGRFFPSTVTPSYFTQQPGMRAKLSRQARGIAPPTALPRFSTMQGTVILPPPYTVVPYEWYPPQEIHGETFCWSGPSPTSGIELPYHMDVPVMVTIKGLPPLRVGDWRGITLSVNGRPVPLTVGAQERYRFLQGIIAPEDQADPSRPLCLLMTVPGVLRPCDHSQAQDKRWVGAAVCSVQLNKLEGKANEGPPPPSARARSTRSEITRQQPSPDPDARHDA